MIPWRDCKRILCIRPDNMGDVLMSAPAIAALKETFGSHITLLTSSMGSAISAYIPNVDDVIEWDVPWVKGTDGETYENFQMVIEAISKRKFDAAVIFTVFSQNPMPAALVATLAGIPNRLAYCRENPYHLLSHWIPEEEPYTLLRHQVRRDLDLVRSIGARLDNERITLRMPGNFEDQVRKKLSDAGVDLLKPWLIVHPGVTEKKREYPSELWVEAGKKITKDLHHQVIVTGAAREKSMATRICEGIGQHSFSLAGELSIEELITLIRFAPLLISVNTGTIHLASAVHTKVVVLYALTNPQHAPWKAIGKILPFTVPDEFRSRNQVLRFVHNRYFSHKQLTVKPGDIYEAAYELLIKKYEPAIDDLVLPFTANAFHGIKSALNFHDP